MVWTRQAASAQFWPASFEVLSFSSLLRKKKKRKRKRKRAYLDASGGSDPTTGITLDPLSLTQLCIFQTCSSLTKTPHSPCFPLASPFLGFFCGFSSSPQPPLFLWGVCVSGYSPQTASLISTLNPSFFFTLVDSHSFKYYLPVTLKSQSPATLLSWAADLNM